VVKGLNFSYSEAAQQGGFSAEQWDGYAESTGTLALQDEVGHGTHVASTVGGDGSLSESQGGRDLAGVAPGVSLISMRVATPGFGVVDDIDWEEAALAAFDWTIRHREESGIDITQNSWGLLPTEPNCLGLDCGEPTDFDAMSQMIKSVVNSGVHVVFSAGNDGPEPGTIGGYHDATNGAILVGAACKAVDSSRCTPGQQIVDFSSRGAADGTGPQVDVVAPGDTIMAALSPSVLAPLTECAEIQQPGYFCISGTSMASPHVSGVAALMLQANPQATPAQVKQCLRSTAVDMMTPGFDIHSGLGMVDAKASLTCVHALTVARKKR
jgi:subtilisin family serine protease